MNATGSIQFGTATCPARLPPEVCMSTTFIVAVIGLAVFALLIAYVNIKERLIENGDLER